jgi:hypothetical protein
MMTIASKYDRPCSVDTDCTTSVTVCTCRSAAVTAAGASQYVADKTAADAEHPHGDACPGFGPCCRGGICRAGSACSPPTDTLPECTDAGGICTLPACFAVGPPSSCAYADATCCSAQ